MNPQMTEPTSTMEQYTPSPEPRETQPLAEVGSVSVTVETFESLETESLETEPTPELLLNNEILSSPVPVSTTNAPSVTVFDIPIELDSSIKDANNADLEGLPKMPIAGLFVTGTSETKPRPARPAEGLNTAGSIEWELAA